MVETSDCSVPSVAGLCEMTMMGMILSEAILTSLEELAPQDDSLGSSFSEAISPLTVRMQVVVEPSLVCSVEMT